MKRNYSLPDGFAPPPSPWPHLLPGPGGDQVAVVIPTIDQQLGPDTTPALESLRHHAPGIDRYLVVPQSLSIGFEHRDFTVIRVPDAAMASIAAYNRLMLTPWFYRLFTAYRSILIYQTDCLLLRGDLAEWAGRGWSYVGAPWFAKRRGSALRGVGNGGFSLRSPADAVKVLTAERFHPWPRYGEQWRQFSSLKHLSILWRHHRRASSSMMVDGEAAHLSAPLATRFVAGFDRPEDEFWAFYAPFFSPDYRLPPPADALDFAWESRPRDALSLNGGRLPLGCHAWTRMGRDFWAEHLPRVQADQTSSNCN